MFTWKQNTVCAGVSEVSSLVAWIRFAWMLLSLLPSNHVHRQRRSDGKARKMQNFVRESWIQDPFLRRQGSKDAKLRQGILDPGSISFWIHWACFACQFDPPDLLVRIGQTTIPFVIAVFVPFGILDKVT
ncbi:hypothetical protein PoB_005096600 [Plakobranchus ocellatus]|uniref:Uncharacterized protein n=1 Tax=Plakobranchus ocellatus TaxID=259542 RepID=A0AAV4BME1_9GAST|nr:hypothetical protein PoB_005096600 [Plakobranchus ocellatus]